MSQPSTSIHSLASCLAAAHISLALSLVAMYRIPPNASGTTLAHHGSQWLNTRHLMFHEKCRIAGAEVASWSPRALREPAAPTDPKWWRQELARSIEEGRPRPAMVRQYATITSYAWGFVGVSLLVSWLLLDRLRKRQEQKQHHQQQHHRDTGAQQSSQ